MQKMQFLAQTPPPPHHPPVQVFDRSQTNATVNSIIWSTYNYTQSMIEGSNLFDHFQFCSILISDIRSKSYLHKVRNILCNN